MSSSKKMRAIRVSEFGAPSVLKLHSDVPVPQPGPKQVLIRVHACGVNPVETYIRSGAHVQKPALPYTPGSDAAGVVEAVGEGVTGLKKGDRVFTTATVSGSYAEFAIATDDSVHKLHDALDYAQGAAIGIPYFTVYRALVHKAHVEPGETVLIHGASGGVGVAACQIARALGLKVLGTAGTPEGMKMILKIGAHQAFNHREKGYTDKIMEATGGNGVDVILEMLAKVNLGKDLQMMDHGGRVLVIGSRGSTEVNPRDSIMKESSIIGVLIFRATPKQNKECAALLYSGMESGWMRPVIGAKYPFDNAAKAHQDIIDTPGATGKMVLTL
ncbi:uncharacterized protein V6R79_006442 [Siganus canaliculatus]